MTDKKNKILILGGGCLSLVLFFTIAITLWIFSNYGSYTTIGKLEPTGQMNVPRVQPQAVQLASGNVLVCNGSQSKFDPGLPFPCEEYDWKAGKFYLVDKLPIYKRYNSMVALKDGRALITGGKIADNNIFPVTNKTFFYNPNTHQFTPGPNMKYYRYRHTSVLLESGRVLVFAGRGHEGILTSAAPMSEIYDPIINTFSEIKSPIFFYGTDTYTHRLKLPDKNIFVLGVGKAELFDVTTKKFIILPENKVFKGKATKMINVLPNGKLIVSVEGSRENYFYLTDPYTGVFEKITSMPPGRGGYTFNTVALKNGNVLFVGGQQTGWSAKYADMELYNYQKNKVIKLGRANIDSPAVFELPNGKILLLGAGRVSAELLVLDKEEH